MLGHASLETTTIYTQVSIRALKEVYARTMRPGTVPRSRQAEQAEPEAVPTEAELWQALDAEAGEETP